MATGTLKWFNATKGYGFITPKGGGRDVFLHISALERAGIQPAQLEDNVTRLDFEKVKGRDDREVAGKLRLHQNA